EVGRTDLSLAQHPALEPADETAPVALPEEDHGEMIELARLDQYQRLEELVERPESARKDEERGRILHEHRLPHEEVAEVDQRIEVRIRLLLEGKLDVAADREPAALLRALVRGFHDARAAARDPR